MSFQKVTGSLMANSHPGSYCGQDAYNDMFVTEHRDVVCRKWTDASSPIEREGRSVELYARSTNTSTENRGGVLSKWLMW